MTHPRKPAIPDVSIVSVGEPTSFPNPRQEFLAAEAAREAGLKREPTYGVSFNPGGDPMFREVEALYAKIIDTLCDTLNTYDKARLMQIAITQAQTAQMSAIKAATRRE